jgi:hypothetical protein
MGSARFVLRIGKGIHVNYKIPLVLMALWVPHAFAAEPQLPAEKIDQAISALPLWKGMQPQVLSHLDLTGPFATTSQWTLVVMQDPNLYSEDTDGLFDHGPIAVCFVRELAADCVETYGGSDWDDSLYELVDDKVVYAGKGNSRPLLWLKTCTLPGGNGNCDVRTVLYAYDVKLDRFTSVFTNDLGHNNNESARFMEDGPIQGDVVVSYPTEDAPYRYWVEVYGPAQSGEYKQILKYRGHTGYNDGNPIPVTWSEMPEILRRLGHWKPGDPLPVPPDSKCKRLSMRHGEEWCE